MASAVNRMSSGHLQAYGETGQRRTTAPGQARGRKAPNKQPQCPQGGCWDTLDCLGKQSSPPPEGECLPCRGPNRAPFGPRGPKRGLPKNGLFQASGAFGTWPFVLPPGWGSSDLGCRYR